MLIIKNGFNEGVLSLTPQIRLFVKNSICQIQMPISYIEKSCVKSNTKWLTDNSVIISLTGKILVSFIKDEKIVEFVCKRLFYGFRRRTKLGLPLLYAYEFENISINSDNKFIGYDYEEKCKELLLNIPEDLLNYTVFIEPFLETPINKSDVLFYHKDNQLYRRSRDFFLREEDSITLNINLRGRSVLFSIEKVVESPNLIGDRDGGLYRHIYTYKARSRIEFNTYTRSINYFKDIIQNNIDHYLESDNSIRLVYNKSIHEIEHEFGIIFFFDMSDDTEYVYGQFC